MSGEQLAEALRARFPDLAARPVDAVNVVALKIGAATTAQRS